MVDVTLVADSLGPRLSGIGRYTWELCKGIPGHRGVGRVRYFVNGRFVEDPAALLSGQEIRRNRMPRWLRQRLTRSRLASSLVHGPNYFLPPEVERGIITVHDLSVLRYPETHPASRLNAFERQLENSIRRAVHIITDTETVRRELLAEFNVCEERISAIHLGVDERYRPRSDESLRAQLAQWGLQPHRYALCVSTLEPRKRIAELIAAWSELPASLRNSAPLVLAGPDGWLNDDLHSRIRDGASQGWLKHLGFVDETVLPELYAGAALFIYPSTYEGFGLPPLEAMASGVPVLVAGRSCLPEVCGDAAAYMDPEDVPGFSRAIEAALTDSHWREEALRKGRERAARFSWQTCIEQTVEVYRRHAL